MNYLLRTNDAPISKKIPKKLGNCTRQFPLLGDYYKGLQEKGENINFSL